MTLTVIHTSLTTLSMYLIFTVKRIIIAHNTKRALGSTYHSDCRVNACLNCCICRTFVFISCTVSTKCLETATNSGFKIHYLQWSVAQ